MSLKTLLKVSHSLFELALISNEKVILYDKPEDQWSFKCSPEFWTSATSGQIVTKFYLKHHWVGGKDALGFGPDRIRTLVSMATDSSHRNIMGQML